LSLASQTRAIEPFGLGHPTLPFLCLAWGILCLNWPTCGNAGKRWLKNRVEHAGMCNEGRRGEEPKPADGEEGLPPRYRVLGLLTHMLAVPRLLMCDCLCPCTRGPRANHPSPVVEVEDGEASQSAFDTSFWCWPASSLQGRRRVAKAREGVGCSYTLPTERHGHWVWGLHCGGHGWASTGRDDHAPDV